MSSNNTSTEIKQHYSNSYGDENFDYFTIANVIEYIKNREIGISSYMKHLYFNKEHPENHCVKKPDESSIAYYYDGEIWKEMPYEIFNNMFLFEYMLFMTHMLEKRFEILPKDVREMLLTQEEYDLFMSSVGRVLHFEPNITLHKNWMEKNPQYVPYSGHK